MEARVPDSNEPDRRLTPRERQVVQQAALGMSNRQIGEELEIAEQTVKNHLSSAMRKLSIRDRTSAVVVALGQGLISVPVVRRREPRSTGSPSSRNCQSAPPKHFRGSARHCVTASQRFCHDDSRAC
jgi:DNA-binding CsgD family transcriptional regulator